MIEKSTSIKSAKKKLHLGQSKMHAQKGKQGKVINNFNEIVKVARDFYSELYSTQTDHVTLVEIKSENTDIPCITTHKI